MNFNEDVKEIFHVVLNDKQNEQFHQYYDFLVEYNKKVNLTAITEQDEVFYKHFFDSLTAINYFNFSQITSLCDMGAGAGFPSIPLKIIYPHLEVTIIDSLNKRILFLEQLTKKLGLESIHLIHERIETYASSHQMNFDLVTARALGDLSLICEMGLPMVKINGNFLAYKGSKIDEELERSMNGIKILGGEIKSVESFELPHNFGFRTIINIKKTKNVKGFPRTFQLMKKKPL
ncbi:MAG: 16S rRNA (guanine(527)-N(7))-methyltransferase RsmG [Acholeplasmataceae bacterium]|jgi:16S rRNA (guanine527-N7)-methyltransferase|nr:16S rRNA (guanine(527)-N(7))-methyltransferase RsmG [Acholeplasmataceae bacterium]